MLNYNHTFINYTMKNAQSIVFLILIAFIAVTISSESHLYFTNFGNILGMDVHFRDKNLRSVDGIFGFPYASIKRQMLRFMPPMKSLEKWLGNRVFGNFSIHGVCPQKRMINYMFEISSFTVLKDEDCLYLNLNIPFCKGKAVYKYRCHLMFNYKTSLRNRYKLRFDCNLKYFSWPCIFEMSLIRKRKCVRINYMAMPMKTSLHYLSFFTLT